MASNSPRSLLDAALARGGFTNTFPVSVAADEVDHPKPAPVLRTADDAGAVCRVWTAHGFGEVALPWHGLPTHDPAPPATRPVALIVDRAPVDELDD